MAFRLITPPVGEPISVSDVEGQLRADLTSESALINTMIAAARAQAETVTRRALIPQTWEAVLDKFPAEIVLPFPPLQYVVSVKYIDVNGAEQTLAAENYLVDSDSEPARVTPAYGKVWPSTRCQVNSVRVRFICGYSFPLFDDGTTYQVGSRVKYADDEKSYRLAETAVAGTLPTDGTKWEEIPESEAVPEAIRQWMLLQVGSMYENREGAGKDVVNPLPFVDGLLDQYRVVRF